jgi:hypothetical protein
MNPKYMGFWMILSISIAVFDSDLRFSAVEVITCFVDTNNLERSTDFDALQGEKRDLLTQHHPLLLWLHKAAGPTIFYQSPL